MAIPQMLKLVPSVSEALGMCAIYFLSFIENFRFENHSKNQMIMIIVNTNIIH
jgi:hypothetical protein